MFIIKSGIICLTWMLLALTARAQVVLPDTLNQPDVPDTIIIIEQPDSILYMPDTSALPAQPAADTLPPAPPPAAQEDTVLLPPQVIDAVEIAIDIGKLATFWTDFEQKWEVGINIVSGYGPVIMAAYGSGEVTPEEAYDNGDYEVSGTYYRGGIGYRFKIGEGSSLTLGANYGMSSFEDAGNINISSELWGDFSDQYQRTGLEAQWAELVLDSQQSLGRYFSIGWVLRVRYLIDYSTFMPADVYAIPGYGRTFDNTVPVFNLILKYRLDL